MCKLSARAWRHAHLFRKWGVVMDISTVTQMITSVGFPICMTLILCYYIKYQTDVHKEETKELTNAINSLREMISEIKTELEGGVKE